MVKYRVPRGIRRKPGKIKTSVLAQNCSLLSLFYTSSLILITPNEVYRSGRAGKRVYIISNGKTLGGLFFSYSK